MMSSPLDPLGKISLHLDHLVEFNKVDTNTSKLRQGLKSIPNRVYRSRILPEFRESLFWA